MSICECSPSPETPGTGADGSEAPAHLVVAGHIGNSSVFPCQEVLHLVDGVILAIHRTDQHVVGDVIQVTAELQPGSSGADVICGAFALHLHTGKRTCSNGAGEKLPRAGGFQRADLNENLHVLQVTPTPLVKGLQQLQTVALRADVHLQAAAVRGGVLVGVLTRVKVLGRELVSVGRIQLELLAVGCCQVVCLRVEVQRSSDGQSSDNLRRTRERRGSKLQTVFPSVGGSATRP